MNMALRRSKMRSAIVKYPASRLRYRNISASPASIIPLLQTRKFERLMSKTDIPALVGNQYDACCSSSCFYRVPRSRESAFASTKLVVPRDIAIYRPWRRVNKRATGRAHESIAQCQVHHAPGCLFLQLGTLPSSNFAASGERRYGSVELSDILYLQNAPVLTTRSVITQKSINLIQRDKAFYTNEYFL